MKLRACFVLDEALLQRDFCDIDCDEPQEWKQNRITVRYIGLDSKQIFHHTMGSVNGNCMLLLHRMTLAFTKQCIEYSCF